jgi:hypothetical protein
MKTMKLSELSSYLQQQGFPNSIDGNAELDIVGVNTLHEATEGEIRFSVFWQTLNTANNYLQPKPPPCWSIMTILNLTP